MHAAQSKAANSVVLQLSMYVTLYYAWFWWLLNLGLQIFKGITLPYPRKEILPIEIVAAFFMMCLQLASHRFCRRGNVLAAFQPLGLGLFIHICLVVGAVYFMWLQAYVIRLDVIFSGIYLALLSITVLCCIGGLHSISQASTVPLQQGGAQKAAKQQQRVGKQQQQQPQQPMPQMPQGGGQPVEGQQTQQQGGAEAVPQAFGNQQQQQQLAPQGTQPNIEPDSQQQQPQVVMQEQPVGVEQAAVPPTIQQGDGQPVVVQQGEVGEYPVIEGVREEVSMAIES